MSQASSSYGGRARVRRVMCPNCHVLANRFIFTTVNNNNRVFHKCPYFAVCASSPLLTAFSFAFFFFSPHWSSLLFLGCRLAILSVGG
jgi:hypothetical protein